MVVIKKTAKKIVKKSAVKKVIVRKTAAKKKNPVKKKVSAKKVVTNKKLKGMIQTNLTYASKAKKPVFVDSEVMPADYGSTSMTLLARDPHWVHAYWEVAPSSIDTLRKNIGDVVDRCTYIVRVYDISLIEFNGSNANHSFDIDVGSEATNWYINLWSDNITCCADIGLRDPDGTFHMLARSNIVTTPREHFSPRSEVVWMEVQQDEEPKAYVYVGRDPESRGSVGTNGRRFRMNLTEDDIRSYYSRLFPMLSKVLAGRKGKKGRRGGGRYVSNPDGELLLERLEDMDFLGYDYFKEVMVGSSEKMLLHRRHLEELLSGGASEQHVSSWGASEREEQEQPKDFFFELGTELIVYGRAEPDAVVFWGDRLIPLREDGTFSLRMALPSDKNIPLDFKAISYGKDEQRTIVTAVNRGKTQYNQ